MEPARYAVVKCLLLSKVHVWTLKGRIVTIWQEILLALRIKKYRPVWQIRSHAFQYLMDAFYSQASFKARGHLLPEQEEALDIIAASSSGGWVEAE